MSNEPGEIRYATGETASVGDRVDNDGLKSVVHDVITTAEKMASWGLDEPGLMLTCKELGLVFLPCSSIAWNAITFEGREGAK